MLHKLIDFVKKDKKPIEPIVSNEPKKRTIQNEFELPASNRVFQNALNRNLQRSANQDMVAMPNVAMDDIGDVKLLSVSNATGISQSLVNWFGSQGFIGHQLCAILAQHWLIAKACLMPAQDAVRNRYNITVNDGTEVEEDIIDAVRRADVKYRLNENLVEFVNMGRVFGIRIALFKVESNDPQYYEKPFNIDGITPGSYKGITQVDPYWITPELDGQAASDPASMYFYEPTWWRVNGRRYHRTHLIIMRNGHVADVLKPTYFYGGIPVPQKIYERVYDAERTATEAPQLALSKRTNVIKVDLAQAIANQAAFEQRTQVFSYFRDNYGLKIIGLDEELQQFDTSLTDLDSIIMTQYQIVAAAANVPATKLLGTTPKGFNATGEYEEASYHEELESIQTHYLTPLIERHHLLLIKSEIAPQFNREPFATSVVWNALDAPTAEEQANLNKIKADTDAVLVSTGAIGGEDIRSRIIADPDSGYSGIDEQMELSDPNSPDINSEQLNDPEEGESEPTTGMKTDRTPGLRTQGD